MKRLTGIFELRNLFRNVYFWLAVGGTIFLLYVGFIAFTFLPRTTSEVTNADKTENSATDKKYCAGYAEKNVSTKGTGKLSGAQISLIKTGGWVDSDDRKMTIVVKVSGLTSATVDEIIREGGIKIEIDGAAATIINSEPFQKNGFLTRAEAVLSNEKFKKFDDGETQSIEIKLILSHGDDTKIDVANRRFAKMNKTEVEGVKINWK